MKKHIIKAVAIMLAIACLLSSCSSQKTAQLSISDIIYPKAADKSYHLISQQTNCNKSEYITLSFDKKSTGITVTDKTGGYLWRSLPDKNPCGYQFAATVLTSNGSRYFLNTQDSSVAFGTVSQKTENGVLEVSYIMSTDEKTAKKSVEELTDSDVYLSFTASYSLYEQSLNITVNLENAKTSPNLKILDFEFMPFFGASDYDTDEDYFLIPEDSGAVMMLSALDAPTDNISVSVYGNDAYCSEGDTAVAKVPAFGVKRGSNAFAATITGGDALAKINAQRKSDTAPSKIGTVFSITPYKCDDDNGILYCSDTSYNGELCINYRLLSSGNDNYMGMAKAVREELILQGTLSDNKKKYDEFPFYVTLIGQSEGVNLTTISQATDILSALKGKGIDSLIINYSNLLSKKPIKSSGFGNKINKALGNKDEFNLLHSYTTEQGYSLFTDANIVSSEKSSGYNREIKSITDDVLTVKDENPLSFKNYSEKTLSARIGNETAQKGAQQRNNTVYSPMKYFDHIAISPKNIFDDFSAFISNSSKLITDGISLNDAGNILFSTNDTSRQENMNYMHSMLKSAGDRMQLSIRDGNIYALTNAFHNYDMSFNTMIYPESRSYIPVPFMQAILHSSVTYSSKPIDAADPLYKFDMLQAIEYGAIPSFLWVYNESSIFCYNGYLFSERIEEISEYYRKADLALYDLLGETMTHHCEITENADGKKISGVYMTRYSNGAEIYVNYTGSIVITPRNIVVGPYDFVRVN